MKRILLLALAIIGVSKMQAQFTQNFESSESNLLSNCWTLTNVYRTSDVNEVITGTGSLFTNPPTNESGTRDIITPALNVTSTNLAVSFNYKLSSALTGNATRSIEVGLLHNNGAYTLLTTLVLNRFSPASVTLFNSSFTLSSTGVKKLVIKLGGSTGDGNSRLIIDDLYVSANPMYGTGTCNSAPIAVNDVFTGLIGNIITGNVTANDNEPDGENLVVSTVSVSSQGILVMAPNGNFIFTPNPLFTGNTTSFTYRLNDNGFAPMNSNVATVTLNYVSAGLLPVELESFSASLAENRSVNLSWTTVTEMNVSHFVVERSIDGLEFSDAGLIFAAGNSNERKHYSFKDHSGSRGANIVYYRLRSVDIDGKTSLSETRMIRFANPMSTLSIQAFPNPATTDIRIAIPATWQNRKVSYEVVSITGHRAVYRENANSSQTENLDISQLPAGVYLVRVSCGAETAQQKIIKQ